MPSLLGAKRSSPAADSAGRMREVMSNFEMPCIRCGRCANACPEILQPQQLLWDLRSENTPAARQHGLLECSECAECDAVCPSHIPLLKIFLDGKSAIHARDSLLSEAKLARERFERRESRLTREAIERAERESELSVQASSGDAVAAAIARAKAKRQKPGSPQ
jgi:electron transport complex protein RnfC